MKLKIDLHLHQYCKVVLLLCGTQFIKWLKQFIDKFFHQDNQQYLKINSHAKKPTIMGVHDFYSHLKIFNAYITVMTGVTFERSTSFSIIEKVGASATIAGDAAVRVRVSKK